MITFEMKYVLPHISRSKKVAVCAPAGAPNQEIINLAITKMKDLGLAAKYYGPTGQQWGTLAGNDSERLSALTSAASASRDSYVIAARGGYGSQRIADGFLQLETGAVIVGYSDITYLLNIMYFERGRLGIHGPLAVDFTNPEKFLSVSLLSDLMKGDNISKTVNRYLNLYSKVCRSGKANGKLIGGNLTLLDNLAGVSRPPKHESHILLLEEIGERPYRIDRSVQHLKRSGFFETVSGVLIGEFQDCADGPSKFALSIEEIICEALPGIPVISGFPIGHGTTNFPMVIGSDICLEA